MYLLDTYVVSELRRLRPHGAVVSWIKKVQEDQLFLSAVTVGEIQSGIEITRGRDSTRAVELEKWLERVERTYAVLPMDAAAFRVWAKLMHNRSDDHLEDGMIAATALVHRLTVVTRNVRDFQSFEVRTLDPFKTGRT
ncbi:MAG: type II toxin-antitoxin system VapC family toxin [Myxococcota bacterium]